MRNTAICISLKLNLLLFSFLVGGVAFSAKAVGIPKTEITKQDSTKKILSRFIVSFGSICCGINHDKRDEFIKFVNEYKGAPIYTSYSWGEEGEIDYCFLLKELTEKEQLVFIKKAQKLLGKERSIRTYENIGCPR
jgi:hypothetical protein